MSDFFQSDYHYRKQINEITQALSSPSSNRNKGLYPFLPSYQGVPGPYVRPPSEDDSWDEFHMYTSGMELVRSNRSMFPRPIFSLKEAESPPTDPATAVQSIAPLPIFSRGSSVAPPVLQSLSQNQKAFHVAAAPDRPGRPVNSGDLVNLLRGSVGWGGVKLRCVK